MPGQWIKRALIVLCLSSSALTAAGQPERRLAIEIDTDAVHFVIADVNPEIDRIIRYLDSGSISADFHKDLMANNNRQFSSQLLAQALSIFAKLKDKSSHLTVNKIRAVATESLRQADNSSQLTQRIRRKTGISIKVLTPEEEDRLDFYSALKVSNASDTPVVWDIGAGRYQLIAGDDTEGPFTHQGTFGSTSFHAYLLEVVQKQVSSQERKLRPLSRKEAEAGIDFARFLARQTSIQTRKAIEQNNGMVIAIGSLFRNSIAGAITAGIIAEHPDSYSRTQLEQVIYRRLNLPPGKQRSTTNEESRNEFYQANLTSALMVYGFMLELEIRELTISKKNSADTLLEYPFLWH